MFPNCPFALRSLLVTGCTPANSASGNVIVDPRVVSSTAVSVTVITSPRWRQHGMSITTAINIGTDAITSIPRTTIKTAPMSIICISGVLLRAVSMVLIIAGTQIQSTSPTDVAQRLVKKQKNAPV